MKKKKPSKIEMRIAVAKDAIKQIKAKIYIAMEGTYTGNLESRLKFASIDIDTQVQPHLLNMNSCRVCARGAAAISCIRKFNNCTVGDFIEKNWESESIKIFGTKNLCNMERAFEGWAKEGELFKESYQDEDKRMIAIFKNVIKNNGTFKFE